MTAATQLGVGRPAILLATWFGVGHVPLIGPLVAAITALPVAWVILWLGGSYGGGALFVATTLLFWSSLWAVSVYWRAAPHLAERRVVVDNVVGQWLPLMFVRPEAVWQFAAAFVLFRIMEVIKPWPANWAAEHLPAGWGMMLDDFFAGVYAAAFMYVTVHVSEHPYVAGLVDRTF